MSNLRRNVAWFALIVVSGLPLSVRAGDATPFKGQAEGQITSLSPGPDGLSIVTVAQGQSTHLGLFAREENAVLNPVSGTISGEMVWTAANGDQLFSSVDGSFVSPTTVAGTYTFTGGTGRFSSAAGQAAFILSTPDGIHYTVQFLGALQK